MKLQALELLYYEKRFSDKIMFNIGKWTVLCKVFHFVTARC